MKKGRKRKEDVEKEDEDEDEDGEKIEEGQHNTKILQCLTKSSNWWPGSALPNASLADANGD